MLVLRDHLPARLSIAGAGLAAVLILASCGSSSNAAAPKAATVTSQATSSSTATSAPQNLGGGPGGQGGGPGGAAFQTSLNSFTKCLRDNGVEVNDITVGNGHVPDDGGVGGPPDGGSVPAGNGIPFGSTPAGGSVPTGGFDGPPPGAGGNGNGFDPTSRIIGQLGLSAEDPAVVKALASCQSILTSAFQPPTAASVN